ncbi:MAG: diaminopimelate dehydrogenase [Nanoarchaeota archaeon]|nr:diaminopimelate dehydrogenase [Nanoarchaeota archaeon]
MSQKIIKVAIVGYGNVGRGVYQAIKRNPDMELAGIISRRPGDISLEVPESNVYSPDNFEKLEADVAILCGGSAKDLPVQGPSFLRSLNTVDSFDTHANIPEYFARMNAIARENKHVAIISAGWDPGTFSLERVLGDAFIPGSSRFTFWGPGVSQGHSDAIRKVEGVADAVQYTLPIQETLDIVRTGSNPQLTTREKHRRDCYVALKSGADPETVKQAIVTMPNYFSDYNTMVAFESPEEVSGRKKQMPHGGFVMTSGVTGDGNKALIEYRNQWKSNPEATGSILIACARANYRLQQDNKFGAFTMLDIPPAYLSPHSQEELLKEFM